MLIVIQHCVVLTGQGLVSWLWKRVGRFNFSVRAGLCVCVGSDDPGHVFLSFPACQIRWNVCYSGDWIEIVGWRW